MSVLTEKLAGFRHQLQEKLPDRQAALVAGHVFFCRKIELPKDISWEDTYAYLELTLESNSPFPIEQLAWGFLSDPDSSFAFVYATPRARLKSVGIELPGNFIHIFPGFVSLFGQKVDTPTVRFVSQNGVLSALFLEANNPVPTQVISVPVNEELLTDTALLEARNNFLNKAQTSDYSVEPGLWLGEGIELSSELQPHFTLRHVAETDPLPLTRHLLNLPASRLWAADLRDTAFAAKESQGRQRSRLIWNSLRFATAGAALLLLGQGAIIGMNTYGSFVEKDLADLEPRATRVENKLTLADRLTRSTEEDLRPFLLMEAINPERPDSIYYDDVRSRAFNQLEIEGQSVQGVSPVNAFADAIEKIPGVESVENNSRTRNNQTSFEFLITFRELPEEPEGGFVIPDPDDTTSDEEASN